MGSAFHEMKKKTAWAVWKKTVRRNETARAWSDGGLHDTVPQGPEREMRREALKAVR